MTVALAALASGADDPPRRSAARTEVQRSGMVARDDRAEALAVARDLKALSDAASDSESAEPGTSIDALLARLGRPARAVTPPTLTPADLDRLIDAEVAAQRVAPARPTDDETFLRRLYLDVAGKLPTPAEIAAFARSNDPQKRSKLIDRLLASEDFARNWARYWRDVIAYRATAENPRQVNFAAFEDWLAAQLAANRPWDAIARDMLTASGDSRENGATALFVAHATNQRFQPVEMAGEASRIFLGVPIACAQCHDHPTDSWTREQFHAFAALFAGTRVRLDRRATPPTRVVSDAPGTPRYTMPDLKDPRRSIPVRPGFFLAGAGGAIPPGLSSEQARALAASYVTGQDNPWFARAFVNRVWYELTGDAFYLPIDDLGPGREANAPEVLDTLADAWARGGYDIKWLYRTILNMRAYQRQVRSTRSEPGRAAFAAAASSRLRADPLFDALAQAVGFGLSRAELRDQLGPARAQKGNVQAALTPRRLEPRNPLNILFGVDPSLPHDEVLGTIPQALFLMNGAQIDRLTRARPDTVLGQVLAAHRDDRAALEALYLRVLARRPNADELRINLGYVRKVGDRREAFEDILWALINSTEFVSRR